MSLFDMCCPKKPKKSLDYVIKWVEDTDKTIKDLSDTVQELNKWKEDISKETLSPIFNEYAETYPWDNVPAFNTKADKVKNVVVGHLASLDENGNLQDSGKKPSDFVPNVSGATEGNLPQFDANGNIQDSGNKAEDFALVGHSHSVILDESTESSVSIEGGIISIFIQGEGSGGETEINANNIGNLHRALVTPSSIPENDATKLITSKAVYDALAVRAPYYDGEIIIRHLDDTIQYPFDGASDVKNKVIALYNAIPKNTYVLCRVTLDNNDYAGTQDEFVTVPAFAYATEGQEGTWNVDIIFANGVKFSAGRRGTYAQFWTKTTNSFFS